MSYHLIDAMITTFTFFLYLFYIYLSFTTGAPAEMYHKDGAMMFEIEDFLPCYKAMCNLTGMEYCGYVFTGAVGYTTRFDQKAIDEQKVHCADHATRLINLIQKL